MSLLWVGYVYRSSGVYTVGQRIGGGGGGGGGGHRVEKCDVLSLA